MGYKNTKTKCLYPKVGYTNTKTVGGGRGGRRRDIKSSRKVEIEHTNNLNNLKTPH